VTLNGSGLLALPVFTIWKNNSDLIVNRDLTLGKLQMGNASNDRNDGLLVLQGGGTTIDDLYDLGTGANKGKVNFSGSGAVLNVLTTDLSVADAESAVGSGLITLNSETVDVGVEGGFSVGAVDVGGASYTRIKPWDPSDASSIKGLYGYWPLDEGAGTTTTNAGTGRSYMGQQATITGATWANDPVRGWVLDFAGVGNGEYVACGDIHHVVMNGDFTWSVWTSLRATDTAESGVIIGNKQNAAGDDNEWASMTPIGMDFRPNDTNTCDYSDVTRIDGNTVWEHHVITRAGGEIRYYRNGVLVAAPDGDDDGTFTKDLTFYIGGDANQSSDSVAGRIDDVGIFNDVLSAGKVAAIHNLSTHVIFGYDLAQVNQLFGAFDASGLVIVDDVEWTYATGLTGADGELTVNGDGYELVLDATAGAGLTGIAPPSLRFGIPSVSNATITVSNATVSADLTSPDGTLSHADVYVAWSADGDKGTNSLSDWTSSLLSANAPTGQVASADFNDGLASRTTYTYRFFAINGGDQAWSEPGTFTTALDYDPTVEFSSIALGGSGNLGSESVTVTDASGIEINLIGSGPTSSNLYSGLLSGNEESGVNVPAVGILDTGVKGGLSDEILNAVRSEVMAVSFSSNVAISQMVFTGLERNDDELVIHGITTDPGAVGVDTLGFDTLSGVSVVWNEKGRSLTLDFSAMELSSGAQAATGVLVSFSNPVALDFFSFSADHTGADSGGAGLSSVSYLPTVPGPLLVALDVANSQWDISPWLVSTHQVYDSSADYKYADGTLAAWMRQAGIGSSRFPGGTLIKTWDWEDPHGADYNTDDLVSNKPKVAAGNWMSLDEYLDYVAAAGIAPHIGVNSLSGVTMATVDGQPYGESGNIARAVRQVEHVVGRGYTNALWYIGNEEAYLHGGIWAYAATCGRYAQAMKAIDPGMKILWNENSATYDTVISALNSDNGQLDGLETHGKWPYGSSPAGFGLGTLDQWKTEIPLRDRKNFRTWRTVSDTYRAAFASKGREGMLLANNEYGIGDQLGGLYRYSLGLIMTELLMEHFVGDWDMTAFWDMYRNETTGMVTSKSNEPGQSFRMNPVGVGMDLLADAQGGTYLKTISTRASAVHGFAAEKNGALLVYLLNKSDSTHTVELQLSGGSYSLVNARCLKQVVDDTSYGNYGHLAKVPVQMQAGTITVEISPMTFTQIVALPSNYSPPSEDPITAMTIDNSVAADYGGVKTTDVKGHLTGWPSDVTVYWGGTDGGTNPAAWQYSKTLDLSTGSFFTPISELVEGHRYVYRYHASSPFNDAWSPALYDFSVWVKIDDNDPSIEYTNNWAHATGPGYKSYPLTDSMSETTGASATFTFEGTRVRWYGHKGWDLGNAEIFLDGVSQGLVDCYRNPVDHALLLYQSPELAAGTHTFEIRVAGTKNASSYGNWITVDAIAWVPLPELTLSHHVPYAWLVAQDDNWSNDYETAATDDPDGDGYTTAEEYWSGTDPRDPNSALRIMQTDIVGSNLRLTWEHAKIDPAIPPIRIQRRNSLTTGDWEYVGEKMPTNGTNSWDDYLSFPRAFYRLVSPDMP
jgi:hypothetical protein